MLRSDVARGACAIALVLGGAIGCAQEDEADPSVAITPIEIDLETARLERAGRPLAQEELPHRPFVLHFWASWCAPCRTELPVLLEAADASGARVLAVSLDSEWDAIGRFFAGPIPRAVVREGEVGLSRTLGVSTLPDTYVIDARGRAIRRIRGARALHRPALRAWLARTAAQSPRLGPVE